MNRTFESFLQERHSKKYIGTDDDMPDAFDSWVAQLDADEFIHYGELFGLECNMKGFKECGEKMTKLIKN
jgi:hypothetical protein